jgi:hypothetical protein
MAGLCARNGEGAASLPISGVELKFYFGGCDHPAAGRRRKKNELSER